MDNIEVEANHVLGQLTQDKRYAKYVDSTLPIPKPFKGSGEIKLIVLGQDPTIPELLKRKSIKTVLNLDKKGGMCTYLAMVCNDLGIRLTENVYATNLYKNFFNYPPTQITEVDIFQTFITPWLPLLQKEIAQFEDLPVLTLGNPILAPLVKNKVSAKMAYYWGYILNWKVGRIDPFRCLKAEDNRLDRTIFPFPHGRTRNHPFYVAQRSSYTLFMKSMVFS